MKQRTRQDIKEEALSIQKQINSLKEKLKELQRENILFSDDEQWYEEKLDTVKREKYARKDNPYYNKKIGTVHYYQYFTDDSKEEKLKIKRQSVVTIDGIFIDNELKQNT